jgi:hypothetical protein
MYNYALMKRFAFLFISTCLAWSCAFAETFPIVHLKQRGAQVKKLVEMLTPESCSRDLRLVYEEIFYTQPSQYDKDELLDVAAELVQLSFGVRQQIRKSIQKFNTDAVYTAECGDAVKGAMRALRAFEDYLGHLLVSNNRPLQLSQELTSNFKLQSGDILLSRGDAFTSATIARLGDEHLQFSHAAFVYIDENQKIYTIEAHMEKGTVVMPIEEYFKDGKVRSTLYRYQDQKLAHQAAKIMFERAKHSSETTGNISYDIQMNLEDSDSLFCSEVIRVGFLEASKNQVSIPMFMTTFSMKNRDLFESLDSEATETFMPADLESDPRFDLIMEWRDFSRINMAWTYDAIITKIFEWMEKDDYRLRNTLKINVIKNLAYAARRTPILKDKLKDRMSLEMTKDMIAATAILYLVVNNFEKKLKLLEVNSLERTGYPLTITQQFEALETIKALKPKFSRAFRK